jgi:hypothetical protein
LRQPDSAVVIGSAYLRSTPDEREPGRLADLIASRCGEGVFDLDGEALRRCLGRRTRQDFADGRVVTIHGWMLSVTEARICGLAALVLGRHGARTLPGRTVWIS